MPSSPLASDRLHKLLKWSYLGSCGLFVLSVAGLVLFLQAIAGARADAVRVVNEVRAFSAAGQKLSMQAVRFNQAAGSDKDRLARECRKGVQDFKDKWTALQADSRITRETPDLIRELEPKMNRLVKRVEGVLELRAGIPLTREDYESLYLLNAELEEQCGKIAGFHTRSTSVSALSYASISWIVFGAFGASAALITLLLLLPLAKRAAATVAQLESSQSTVTDLRQAAEETSRSKALFMAHVAPRLRMASAEILERANFLEKELTQKNQGEFADYAESIRARAEQMLGVVNDVLNLALIDSGSVPQLLRAVNLTKLMEDMVPYLQPKAENKGLVFTLNPAAQEVWVMGDSDQIWRMIDKIYDNAVKYTEYGEASITLSARPDGRVTIAIRDTGRGIPPAELPTIFEPKPFEEEVETQPGEGLGINLSVAQQLASHMHSVISVHSDVDKGTTFLIDMPGCTPEGKLLASA